MLTIGTAQELRDAGLEWTPATLDFFFIPLPDLENQIFVISDMTILSEQLQGQPALTFHGTVEWALDHVWTGEALWVPREDQLRELLGDRLASVHRTDSGWEVRYAAGDGTRHTVTEADLECAYALALLTL